ncbi:MAG: SOS response-associated peptidase family protein [Sedimentibacter sp.]
MCGRYYMDIDEKEFKEAVNQAEKNVYKECKTGEIFPSNIAPIYIKEDETMRPIYAKWGFPRWDKKGIVINARVESLEKTQMFKNLVELNRCIVPASAYFEWKGENSNSKIKSKYIFKKPDALLYMAGLFSVVQNQKNKQFSFFDENQMDIYYTIITKEANLSVTQIHNRMPLIFDKHEMNDYLNGKSITQLTKGNNVILLNQII